MILRKLISVLLIAIYAIIIGHDVMSHHHHQKSTACLITNHPNTNSNHNECSHTTDCGFPFHQHSMNEAGVFLNTSTLVLNFDIQSLSPKELFNYSDLIEFENDKYQVDFIPLIYKGPNLTSASLRGPPKV